MNARYTGVRRGVAELVVIVVGILIALGAESWWQDRQASQLEQDYLEAFLVDIERTIDENNREIEGQRSTQEAMERIAALIAAGAPLPDTLVRIFPPVAVLMESMDTYRDLVTSGGTTQIKSLEVRRAMSQLLASVEYQHVADDWALDPITSIRAANLSASRPVPRDRLADTWSIYLDAGDRLQRGKIRLSAVADTALAVVKAEIEGR